MNPKRLFLISATICAATLVVFAVTVGLNKVFLDKLIAVFGDRVVGVQSTELKYFVTLPLIQMFFILANLWLYLRWDKTHDAFFNTFGPLAHATSGALGRVFRKFVVNFDYMFAVLFSAIAAFVSVGTLFRALGAIAKYSG